MATAICGVALAYIGWCLFVGGAFGGLASAIGTFGQRGGIETSVISESGIASESEVEVETPEPLDVLVTPGPDILQKLVSVTLKDKTGNEPANDRK